MKTIISIVMMLASSIAFADDLEFLWEAPTSRINGDPISASDISHYILGCARNSSDYSEVVSIPGSVTSYATTVTSITSGQTGTFNCAMKAVDMEGQQSAWSNEASFKVNPAPPKAPTDFRVRLL
jgi:hypothetical protein